MRKILMLSLVFSFLTLLAPLSASAGVVKTLWNLSPDKVVCHYVPAVVLHPKKDAKAVKKAVKIAAKVVW